MNGIFKNVLLIVSSILFFQILLNGAATNTGEEKTLGLQNIQIGCKKNWYLNNLNEKNLTKKNSVDNLKKYTNIEDWLKNNGLNSTNANIYSVYIYISKSVQKMWKDSISKLQNCPEFKAHDNGYTEYLFNKNINEGSMDFVFLEKGIISSFDSVSRAMYLDQFNLMAIHLEELGKIVEYAAKKIQNGDDEIDVSDINDDVGTSEGFHELTGYIGHELMHKFARMDLAEYKKNPHVVAKWECTVHCLQTKCLDSSHRQMMNACDGDNSQAPDTFCDEDDTCEFSRCGQ